MVTPAAVRAFLGQEAPRFLGKPLSTCSLKPLPSGLYNHNYLALLNGKKYAIKIYMEPVAGAVINNNGEDEANALRTVEGLGVAPRPVHLSRDNDIRRQILIYEYVEGETLTDPSAATVKRLAQRLAMIHNLPLAAVKGIPRKDDSVAQLLRSSEEQLRQLQASAVDEEIKKIYWDAHAAVRASPLYRREIPYPETLTHGDLAPCNIIAGKDISFIDWQSPNISDPLLDVWAFVEDLYVAWDWDAPLSKSQKELFMDAYLHERSDSTIKERLAQKTPLYYLTLGLYCELRYQLYAQRRIPPGKLKGREHLWKKYLRLAQVARTHLREYLSG